MFSSLTAGGGSSKGVLAALAALILAWGRVWRGGRPGRILAHLSGGRGEGRGILTLLERLFGLILGGGTPLPLRPFSIHLGGSPPPSPNIEIDCYGKTLKS